ncbi:hypothetical protein TNCV_477541 [Trichonephila clavipes]|nr:hypothetical protein TNCV_477541 [Trichonephila clavipes]
MAIFSTYFAVSSSTFPTCDDFQYSYSVRFHILHGSHSVFSYPKNHVSERCPVPIDSDKRRSTATLFFDISTKYIEAFVISLDKLQKTFQENSGLCIRKKRLTAMGE